MRGTIYNVPATAVVRLEAIWTVRVSHARFLSTYLKKLLPRLASVSKQEYKPSGGANRGGYLASLVFSSIEPVVDSPETTPYPDW